ncbi:complex I subunit 5 family protein [Candidatus Zixiibacteriota bacterium]
MNPILPLFIAIPLAAAFLILILAKLWRGVGSPLAFLTSVCLVIFAISIIGQEAGVYQMGNWPPPWGIVLVSDGLSTLLLLTISVITFLAILFSIRYMDRYTAKPKFFALFMLLVGGMNGVVLTGDFFNLFVFLEIASIASYALVAFGCEHEELEASFKYMILSGVASTFVLLGIAILYSLTGTLNMADVSRTIAGLNNNSAVLFSMALFIMGFGLKAALVPFHPWLPDAHPAAPAPISAMLSGVLIKALGVYVLIRLIFNVFGLSPFIATVLMVLGALSMVVGGLLAIGQDDLKRLLAYSSISQIGYVVVALSLGTPLGIVGGLFHLINHATFKSLLFLSSGAIEYGTDTRKLSQMGGLSRRMPVTTTTAAVGFLSISGIPPLNGFWSKLIIVIALVQAEQYVLASLSVLVSFLTILYFMRVQRNLFFGDLPAKLAKIKEVPYLMRISLVVLAVMCLAMGLLYPLLSGTILNPARDVLLEGTAYVQRVFGI